MMRFISCAWIAGLLCLVGCGTDVRLFVSAQIDHGSGGEPIGTGLSVMTRVLRTECQWDFDEPICPDTETVELSEAFGDGAVAHAEARQGGLVVTGLTPGIGAIQVDGEVDGDFEVEVLATKLANIEWSAADASPIGSGVVLTGAEFAITQRHFPVTAAELRTIPPRHWGEVELQGRSQLEIDADATEATLRADDSGPPLYFVKDDVFNAGSQVGSCSIRSESGAQLNLEVTTEAAIAEIRFLDAGEIYPYTTVELERLKVSSFESETILVAPFDEGGTRIVGCPEPPDVSVEGADIEAEYERSSGRSCLLRVRRLSADAGGIVTIVWGEQTATLPLD